MGKRPVVVELQGRLGNQLFQFAAGYALSRRFGCELLFDSRRVPRGGLTLPDVIGERYREARDRDLLRVGRRDPRLPRRFSRYLRSEIALARARGLRHQLAFIEKVHLRYDAGLLDAPPPVLLRGFFQSERYFEEVADEIEDAINLPSLEHVWPTDMARPVIGVSFRRGDFVQYGWTLPVRYQEVALQRLCVRVQPGTLLVFCDDAEFADLVLPRIERFGPARNAQHFLPDHVAGMAVQAACDHFVIANSTFSWWGAWLGDRRSADPDRIVLAPRGWLDRQQDVDVIPKRWEIVDWE